MIARYSCAFGTAATVTLGLLLVMQGLIAVGRELPLQPPAPYPVDWVRVERAPPPEPRREPPKRPPEPRTKPSTDPQTKDAGYTTVTWIGLPPPPLGPSRQVPIGIPDGAALAMVRVMPTYPIDAITRGLEGHVDVRFTISALGTVVDPVVVESTHRIFEKPALVAASKFKYRPTVVGGTAVAVTGVRYRFVFELDDE